MASSAGKREITKPGRYCDEGVKTTTITTKSVFGNKMSNPPTTVVGTSTTSVPTGSLITVGDLPKPPSHDDTHEILQKMMRQMAAQFALSIEIKKSVNKNLELFRKESQERHVDCVNRWQVVDVRTTQLEDKIVQHD